MCDIIGVMPYKDPERQREYQREWIASRRRKYLKDKCCLVCGSTKDLELDHIERNNKIDHRIWSWSQERFQEEILKCQILCKEHHREKTTAEIEPGHGTDSRYTSHIYKCRCVDCKEAHRVANLKYR